MSIFYKSKTTHGILVTLFKQKIKKIKQCMFEGRHFNSSAYTHCVTNLLFI